MAKIEYSTGDFGNELDRLTSRENIRRIVEAGSAAAIRLEQERTVSAGHVITGKMRDAISAGKIHEDPDKTWQYVYPGADGDQKEAMIAYVINYGAGGKRTAKTGDKFITGNKKQFEDVVRAAMAAEAERIKNDIMR